MGKLNGAAVDDLYDRQHLLFEAAIERQLAIPPWLRDALEDAPRTGNLPTAERLLEVIDQESAYLRGEPHCWDGTVDGETLFDAEAALWCTLRTRYGWGIPCQESLDAVSRQCNPAGRLIEVGAGTGYWAAVLRARGIDVLAVDAGRNSLQDIGRWHMITYMQGSEAIRLNPAVPVLVCWPDFSGVGDSLCRAMQPGQIMLRTGVQDVTGGEAFNQTCRTHFDLISADPAVSATGTRDCIDTLRRTSLECGRFV
jgi:hypothetical protein